MRKLSICGVLYCFLLLCAGEVYPQSKGPTKRAPARSEPAEISTVDATASPAYAELLLKKTELRSELEALILDYTEEYPRVRELRHVIGLIDREIGRLMKVKAADSQRLTLALGRLMLRKVEFEADVWKLLKAYKEEHPDVKQARRKVEVFESAIVDILN